MLERSLTLVLGGARSGKSSYAEQLAMQHPAPWFYIATAQAFDDEMGERITLHRQRRGEGWQTIEAPLDLAEAITRIPDGAPLLIDCLTLWLSNHMLAGRDVDAAACALEPLMVAPRGSWFVVSNEVGLGIVPETPLGRRFRDAQGRLNQHVAAIADRVVLMVAGMPLKVKS